MCKKKTVVDLNGPGSAYSRYGCATASLPAGHLSEHEATGRADGKKNGASSDGERRISRLVDISPPGSRSLSPVWCLGLAGVKPAEGAETRQHSDGPSRAAPPFVPSSRLPLPGLSSGRALRMRTACSESGDGARRGTHARSPFEERRARKPCCACADNGQSVKRMRFWFLSVFKKTKTKKTRTNVSKSRVLKAMTTTTSDISSRAVTSRPSWTIFVHDEKIVYLRNYNTLSGIIFK